MKLFGQHLFFVAILGFIFCMPWRLSTWLPLAFGSPTVFASNFLPVKEKFSPVLTRTFIRRSYCYLSCYWSTRSAVASSVVFQLVQCILYIHQTNLRSWYSCCCSYSGRWDLSRLERFSNLRLHKFEGTENCKFGTKSQNRRALLAIVPSSIPTSQFRCCSYLQTKTSSNIQTFLFKMKEPIVCSVAHVTRYTGTGKLMLGRCCLNSCYMSQSCVRSLLIIFAGREQKS